MQTHALSINNTQQFRPSILSQNPSTVASKLLQSAPTLITLVHLHRLKAKEKERYERKRKYQDTLLTPNPELKGW